MEPIGTDKSKGAKIQISQKPLFDFFNLTNHLFIFVKVAFGLYVPFRMSLIFLSKALFIKKLDDQ